MFPTPKRSPPESDLLFRLGLARIRPSLPQMQVPERRFETGGSMTMLGFSVSATTEIDYIRLSQSSCIETFVTESDSDERFLIPFVPIDDESKPDSITQTVFTHATKSKGLVDDFITLDQAPKTLSLNISFLLSLSIGC
jgi:hypothetical protein